MKGQKMLKVCSILLIIASAFAIVAGVVGIIDANTMLFLCISTIVIAAVALVAAVLGAGAAKMPSINKIKGGIILGALSLLLSIIANIYGAVNAYTDYPLLMAANIVQAVFALLFVIAIIQYKNGLLAMLQGD